MPRVRASLDCTLRPPRARVRMSGEFDLSVRGHLTDVLTWLRSSGCSSIEIDAQDVSFVDAACLGALHAEAQRLHQAGGALRLIAASSRFSKIVEVAGYASLFPSTSATDAVEARPETGIRPEPESLAPQPQNRLG